MKTLTNEKVTIYDWMKWGEAVLTSYGRPDAPIDAKLLMKHLLDFNETQLLLERNKMIPENIKESYAYLIAKRGQGIPLQYITNQQDFMGLPFYVDERVLIPRQDTETLVEYIIDLAKKHPIQTGIDIGTGSGCISVALTHYIEGLKMTALDLSEAALEVAKKNAKANGLSERITFIQSDVFSNFPEGQLVDLVVSNPPYISKEDCKTLMKEVKSHEPHMALTDDSDGLTFYKIISKDAKKVLKPNGIIAYEIGYNQSKEVTAILEEEGYHEIVTIQDLAGKDRVVIARI